MACIDYDNAKWVWKYLYLVTWRLLLQLNDVSFLLSQVGSMEFLLTLRSNYKHVMVYEDLELQQKARNQLPYEELSSAAVEKLERAKASDPGTTNQNHFGCRNEWIEWRMSEELWQ